MCERPCRALLHYILLHFTALFVACFTVDIVLEYALYHALLNCVQPAQPMPVCVQLPTHTDSFSLPEPDDCNMPSRHSDMCILRVRRTRLIDDALSEISRQCKRDLFKPLRVHFIGEEGIDAGG